MEDGVGEGSPSLPLLSSCRLSATESFCFSDSVAATSCSSSPDESAVERLLPADYEQMLSRAVAPVRYSSKSELYGLLSNSILIDDGRKSFSVEQETGKKCFLLSVKDMCVTHGGNRSYWRWPSQPQISRFSQVAELIEVCWLDVFGKLEVSELSQGTLYAAYLVFRLKEGWHGLDGLQEGSVALGSYASRRWVCLDPSKDTLEECGPAGVPHPRGDGWMELQLGEFMVAAEEDDGKTVIFRLREVERRSWKSGLVIEGVELRPKTS
uniref:F-box protein At2g02240 n=1 Tax=Anthurium amnicola TaxID=1678845 RepID=A0A1D1Z7R8_9ARAE